MNVKNSTVLCLIMVYSVYLDFTPCPNALNAHHAALIGLDGANATLSHIPSINSLHYRFEGIKIPYLPQHNIDVLVYYIKRNDGRLPIFKDHVFTKEWNTDAGCVTNEDTYVLNLLAVFDGRNVEFHVVTHKHDETTCAQWFAKHLFDGLLEFESEHDKLQTEEIILLHKMCDPGCATKYKRRYEKVDKLLHEDSSSDSDL